MTSLRHISSRGLFVLLAVSCGGGPGPAVSDTGADCTGSFEAVQNVNGHALCVATLVTIGDPGGSSDYQIDATEVTREQYQSWVATNPALPSSSDTACGWKSSGSYAEDSDCMMSPYVCKGTGCGHHPQVCVDWCDAYAYCKGVGKRLCGKIGGGSNDPDDLDDATKSQWYAACTSNGTYGRDGYVYGETYEPTACNEFGYWGNDLNKMTTLPVASLSACQSSVSGYAGVYDLSGNVSEWEDSCGSATGHPDWCRVRGGSYFSDLGFAECGYTIYYDNNADADEVGFRCCS